MLAANASHMPARRPSTAITLSANMAEEMAVEAPPTAGSGIVRQLPASAEYLPTEEQTADMEFLAMVAQGASRNDEIVAAIDAGQYINVADIRGNTIMHLILQRGPHQVGCLGGRHHLPESNSLTESRTALALTTTGPEQEDFVKLMHSKGAAIDYKNEKGKTPLMIAVAFQRHDLIAYFIENGADVKVRDAQCPMPNAQRSTLKAQRPMPNAQCTMPNAQCKRMGHAGARRGGQVDPSHRVLVRPPRGKS